MPHLVRIPFFYAVLTAVISFYPAIFIFAVLVSLSQFTSAPNASETNLSGTIVLLFFISAGAVRVIVLLSGEKNSQLKIIYCNKK